MFFIRLLLDLGMILFFLSILLYLDSMYINLAIYNIKKDNYFGFLLLGIFSLMFTFAVWHLCISLVEEYKRIKKNYFLDTYIFPKELFKIISEKYPHLKKSEVAEVLESMKEFYSFEINKDSSKHSYMPSRVVDFACQTFFDMSNSSLFFEKLLLERNKYHRILPKGTAVLLAGQYEEHINSIISEMWCYCCKKEGIDPFFPLSFPSFFTLDKRLKIPSGFIFELDETLFRETHSISEAPTINTLKDEIEEIDNIDYLAKKIQYYLGSYDYCHLHQKEEFKDFFRIIDENYPLAHAIYGQYSDVKLLKKTVLDNAVENMGCSCSSGASI